MTSNGIFVWVLLLTLNEALAREARIVNGTNADIEEFPYIVSLKRSRNSLHSCGASILNPMWILTAGHCVSRLKPENVIIQYGSSIVSRTGPTLVNTSKIFLHPGYLPANQFLHDIALVKLQEPIKFSRSARAVKLPEAMETTLADPLSILLGWGLNATGGEIQTHLQKVHLKVVLTDECSKRHQVPIHSSNLCVEFEGGGRGQCSGDSGGPLINDDMQIGIVSWSVKPCAVAPYPGVLTKVSSYIEWIYSTIEDDIDSPI